MTTKEKAIDLVKRFKNINIDYIAYAGSRPEKFPLSWEEAKQCALISVDFYLKEHADWANAACCAEDFPAKYWNEVKEEIKKL